MSYRIPDVLRRGMRPLFGLARRVAAIASAALLLSLAVLPALAHDEDGAARPPTAEAQAAGARMTIAVLSLVTGIAVYYVVQRHALINGDKHPPEWGQKMSRNAILFAIVSAVAVGGATAALSRPAPKHHDEGPGVGMGPNGPVTLEVNDGSAKKADTGKPDTTKPGSGKAEAMKPESGAPSK